MATQTDPTVKATVAVSDYPELTPEQLAKFRPFREFLAEREKTRLEAERKVA